MCDIAPTYTNLGKKIRTFPILALQMVCHDYYLSMRKYSAFYRQEPTSDQSSEIDRLLALFTESEDLMIKRMENTINRRILSDPFK